MLDNERFTYDKVGNRLTSAKQAGVWAYNDADQLKSTPVANYVYDLNGHTKSVDYADNITIPDVGYVYDVSERLHAVVKTQDGSKIQSNRYDFTHRRIGKTASSSTTYFLYGETGLVAEYQSNGDFVKGYGYYPKTSYTTNPVYTLRQNGASYEADFYHNDHLATPQKLTNSTGTISWAMESNAFGETTIKMQTTTNNLRFPGQYADSDIGLSQNYFRDYAPNLGRYVESDPIGLRGGINWYSYVEGRPVRFTDFLGLTPDPNIPIDPSNLPKPPPGKPTLRPPEPRIKPPCDKRQDGKFCQRTASACITFCKVSPLTKTPWTIAGCLAGCGAWLLICLTARYD